MDVHLAPVEAAIRQHMIPAMLGILPAELTEEMRTLVSHGVKRGGMNFRNPAESAARHFQASREGAELLVASLLANGTLDSEGHRGRVRKAGAAARKERVDAETVVIEEMRASARKIERKRLERIGECGSWITRTPHKLTGTLLSAEEWEDNVRLRYGLVPHNLCAHCDGCGEQFTVDHALNCKKGGLVGIRHDDVRDKAGAVAVEALSKGRVSYEPPINYSKD